MNDDTATKHGVSYSRGGIELVNTFLPDRKLMQTKMDKSSETSTNMMLL